MADPVVAIIIGAPGVHNIIDHRIFKNALNIIFGLKNWDSFDPFKDVNLALAWIAIATDKSVHIARTGVVCGHGHGVIATVNIHQPAKITGAKADIIKRILGQCIETIGKTNLSSLFSRRGGQELHQAARFRMADRALAELAFLTGNGMNDRPVILIAFWYRHLREGDFLELIKTIGTGALTSNYSQITTSNAAGQLTNQNIISLIFSFG